MGRMICVLGSYVCQMSACLPHVPKPGETIVSSKFDMGPGGKGNNVAIGIKRLGGDVLLIEKLGDDIFGDIALKAYQKEKIDTSYVKKIKEVQSGIGLVYIQPSGENTAAYFAGANETLTREDISKACRKINKAAILYIQLEIPDEPIIAAIDCARKNHTKVILNPAPARKISAEVLRNVDVLTPNQVEAMQLASMDFKENLDNNEVIELGKRLLSLGPSEVYITLGSLGAFYINQENDQIFQKAIRVNAIDTVGAGDSFNAALCVALAENRPVREALLRACINGALTTTKLGVINALPGKNEVEDFIKTIPFRQGVSK